MSKPLTQTTIIKMASVYEYWKANPHLKLDELRECKGGNRKDLNQYMKENGLTRPDGRVIGKGSPRQQAIKASYEAAIKANETPGWAQRYARDTFSIKADKSDFRYYAMKNDLPYLKEVASQMQESPSKLKL
jgi:hypothetical protein